MSDSDGGPGVGFPTKKKTSKTSGKSAEKSAEKLVIESDYTDFPIVEVKFPSGSWVSFQLGYGDNMEEVRFYKKYDAQSETTKDLLDRFNNQKA